MNETELRKELEYFEGNKTKVYLDSVGLPTVGVGHMDRNMIVGTVMGPSQIDAYYQSDVRNALIIAKKNCNFDSLDDIRQRIMIQLCFNLGNRIETFKHFLAAMNVHNWDQAAKELENSEWYKQVARRGPITCAALRNGVYNLDK